MQLTNYFEDPKTIHIGCCEPRAYFIPFSEYKGDRTIELSGDDWKVAWFQNHLEVNEDFIHSDCEQYDIITVPSCLNILGYDKHQYANVLMPIPFDPPYVPSQNPCAAYQKKFYIDEKIDNYFLNFEGVDSCFYLWLNGEFIGYSQVSHSTSEFDITDYVNEGENLLSVLVLKWCDGTYFEDQDKLRMTGIFRDVYILNRPKDHIRDFVVKTTVSPTSTIAVNLKVNGTPGDILVNLYSPDGEVISQQRCDNNSVVFEVENALLWNAETPYLYTLEIVCNNETIIQRVGIKSAYIKDSVLYFNNNKIKLKGVNRHDSDPFSGYTISYQQLFHDLTIMKQHNVNAIRTSHYPNAPWAYDMYSEFGFYVIDEADIETHNTQSIYGNKAGYSQDYSLVNIDAAFGSLCSDPTYEETILDRVVRCVERDKNSACVLMWSLGNESGYGVNMEKAAAWIKSQDSDYLVHYESSIWQMPDHENDLSNIDVYSKMYWNTEHCVNYLENNPEKPFIQCEFVHAMGNGPGDIEDYYELIYKYDSFAGGFVWEWCDHAVYMGQTVEGKDMYYYGGDFGEYPHDGNFCMDGLVYPDRTPHTGLLELKNVTRPVKCSYKDGKITLFNTLDFVNIEDRFDINWELIVDNKCVESGTIENISLPPHSYCTIDLPYNCSVETNSDCSLMIAYTAKEDYSLISVGDCLGFDQIILNKAEYAPHIDNGSNISVEDNGRYFTVSNDKFRYIFDKFTSNPTELYSNNRSYIDCPMEYNILRAYIDNDRVIKEEWKKAGYDRVTTKVYDATYNVGAESVTLTFKVGLGAIHVQNFLKMTTVYTIYSDGTINVKADGDFNTIFPFLPRFGLRLFLPNSINDVTYIGYGPTESYVDKIHSCYYGEFSSSVAGLHEDYIKPQENGSHCGCNLLSVEGDGRAITVYGKDFSFNASKYTQEALDSTAHNFELTESGHTVLCIDSRMSGVGSGSCGPQLLDKYRVNEEKISLDFSIKLH